MLAGCMGSSDQENEYPSQEIEKIVSYPSGGGTDRIGRELAGHAEEDLGVSVYVSNVTGATGSVGHTELIRAESDGYTIGMIDGIHIYQPLGIADIEPDDLQPVIQVNADPAAVAVHQDADYGTVDELISYAKDNPGEINFSDAGPGSFWHFASAGFAQETGIEVGHIHYEGGEPAVTAVVNGEVAATSVSVPEVRSQVEDGPLELLAVMGAERSNLFPNTPTLKEEGINWEMGAIRGIGVPNDTDESIVETLHDTYREIMQTDEFEEFMTSNGFGIVYRDTEEFEQFYQDQQEVISNLVEDLDVGSE